MKGTGKQRFNRIVTNQQAGSGWAEPNDRDQYLKTIIINLVSEEAALRCVLDHLS